MTETQQNAIQLAIETIGYYASVCNEDDQDTPAKQTQKVLRAALEQPAPVHEQQPVAFASPEQLNDLHESEGEHGEYLPLRKTPAGKFVQPLYTAQPRKAVRLTTDEIKEAIRHLYQDATALQMSMDLSLDEFRAIEAAVLKANGVEE